MTWGRSGASTPKWISQAARTPDDGLISFLPLAAASSAAGRGRPTRRAIFCGAGCRGRLLVLYHCQQGQGGIVRGFMHQTRRRSACRAWLPLRGRGLSCFPLARLRLQDPSTPRPRPAPLQRFRYVATQAKRVDQQRSEGGMGCGTQGNGRGHDWHGGGAGRGSTGVV